MIYGYSLAFTDGGGLSAFIGDFSKLFLAGVNPGTVVETFSRGVFIPELTFVIFQLTFAAITPALIIGAIAERMKFSAVMLFLALWFTFSYLPIAHMVWWWAGPEFAATHTAEETVAISGLSGARRLRLRRRHGRPHQCRCGRPRRRDHARPAHRLPTRSPWRRTTSPSP